MGDLLGDFAVNCSRESDLHSGDVDELENEDLPSFLDESLRGSKALMDFEVANADEVLRIITTLCTAIDALRIGDTCKSLLAQFLTKKSSDRSPIAMGRSSCSQAIVISIMSL